MTRTQRRFGLVPVALALIVTAACGGDNNDGAGGSTGDQLSGSVRVDGSSTVAPLSEAAADFYRQAQPGVHVTVGTSGTGAGFEKFCAGETDISDASRAIKDEEKQACAAKGITPTELIVANDALTVVVNKANDWVTCLTVEQLKKIWDQGSTVTNWNQVDPSFPDRPLTDKHLFGPGTDSGTFDYFTDEINGEEGRSRTNYTPSENDNVLVQGVAADENALGYFGFTYFEENQDTLKAVEVDGGSGCVAPSVAAAQDGSYQPLSRPLFIYVSSAAKSKPEVVDFVDFYIENIDEVVEDAQYVPLTAEQKSALATQFAGFKG